MLGTSMWSRGVVAPHGPAPCVAFPTVRAGDASPRCCRSILNREDFQKALENQSGELNNNEGFFPLSP